MKKRVSFRRFANNLRRDTLTSVGDEIGTKEFLKALKSYLSHLQKFSTTNEFLEKVKTVRKGLSLFNKLPSDLVDNGHGSATNRDSENIPLISESEPSSLGKNDPIYSKTHLHFGNPSGGRIRNLRSGPSVEPINR